MQNDHFCHSDNVFIHCNFDIPNARVLRGSTKYREIVELSTLQFSKTPQKDDKRFRWRVSHAQKYFSALVSLISNSNVKSTEREVNFTV